MRRLGRLELERVALAAVAVLALASGGVLLPNVLRALRPAPAPPVVPAVSPPPAAVLLPDERQRALQSVFILTADSSAGSRVGTAFVVDARGDLLTSADLVAGATALRLIDNTGGSHRVVLVGVDGGLDLALVRVPLGVPPLSMPSPAALPSAGTPLEILAPPKNGDLTASTPATVSATGPVLIAGQDQPAIRLRADIHPAHSGAPVLGSGAVLEGIIVLAGDSETLTGVALPIAGAQPDLSAWTGRAGQLLPLASLPDGLILRGDTGPVTAPSVAAGVQITGISPTRAVNGTATVLTVRGAGFTAGRSLRVHFTPVGSQGGGFDGVKATVVAPDTLTVTVPQGEAVQDYVVQLTNGDGTLSAPGPTLTVLP